MSWEVRHTKLDQYYISAYLRRPLHIDNAHAQEDAPGLKFSQLFWQTLFHQIGRAHV